MEGTRWDFREIADAQQDVIRQQRSELDAAAVEAGQLRDIIAAMEDELADGEAKRRNLRRQLVRALDDGARAKADALRLRREMDTAAGMVGVG